MSSLPRISEAEWAVMQVVWDSPGVAASHVVETLAPETGWNHRTIRTMLNRLVSKGALTFRQEGNRYLYRAKVKRQSYVKAESRSFLKRLFSGDAASLLVHFVENESLTDEEILRLKQALEQQSEKEET